MRSSPAAPISAFLLLIAALAAPPAHAQVVKAKPSTAPPDTRPLARYVPKDNLYFYAGTDGLDAHPAAWKGSTLHKLLNDTTLGEMLEAVVTQLADKGLGNLPNRKISGADAVLVFKHLMKSGFALALNIGTPEKGEVPDFGAIVIRGGATKEVRAPFSRLMGQFMAASKPAVAKKEGRSVVVVSTPAAKDLWSWWDEKGDLVITFGANTDKAVLEVIDGKRPNALDNPSRAELSKVDGGFEPVFLAFMDLKANKPGGVASRDQFFAGAQQAGINRVDFRWGFQADASMTMARIMAPKPRKGLLALFDQPSFDRTKIPPLPEGIESFTVFSADLLKTFDAVNAAGPAPGPAAGAQAQVGSLIETLKTKARVDVRKDLLPYLGPKMVFYVLPPANGAKPAETAPANPFAALTGGGNPFMALAATGVPRAALVAEVKDPETFAKTLDNLMVAVNRQLKDQAKAAATAAAAAAAAGRPGAPGGPRPPGGRPGGGGGITGMGLSDEGPNPGGGGATKRAAPPAAPEFKLMPAKEKERVYALNFPPGSNRQFPAGFKPTFRLGAKYFAIATTPDSARLALEAKPGEWVPPSDLVPAFDQLPKGLTFLSVNDPRSTTPEILASLPGTLQIAANTLLAVMNRPPEAPGGPGAPGSSDLVGGGGGGGRFVLPTPGAMGAGGGNSVSLPQAGAMGGSGGPMSGNPGGGGSNGGKPEDSFITFKIDPAKLPKADDLRSKMYPGTFTVSTDDSEIRFTTRQSFPNLANNVVGGSIAAALLLPAVQAARDAARRVNAAKAASLGGAPSTPGGAPPAMSPGGGAVSAPPRPPGSAGEPPEPGSAGGPSAPGANISRPPGVSPPSGPRIR